jgi:hypothetical protein
MAWPFVNQALVGGQAAWLYFLAIGVWIFLENN